MTADGWVDVSYQMEAGSTPSMTIVSRKEANGKALAKNKPNRDQLAPDNANSKRVVKLQVVRREARRARYNPAQVLRLSHCGHPVATHSGRSQ